MKLNYKVSLQILELPTLAVDSLKLDADPRILVRGFNGEPNDLMVIVNGRHINPLKPPLIFSQQAVLSQDCFTFTFDRLAIGSGNNDDKNENFNKIELEFHLFNRRNFNHLASCKSPIIDFISLHHFSILQDKFNKYIQDLQVILDEHDDDDDNEDD